MFTELDSSLETVANDMGLTVEEIIGWSTTYENVYRFGVNPDNITCLYTDGDDGFMFFSAYSEIFEEKGMTVAVIGNWCDIPYDIMREIIDAFEERLDI